MGSGHVPRGEALDQRHSGCPGARTAVESGRCPVPRHPMLAPCSPRPTLGRVRVSPSLAGLSVAIGLLHGCAKWDAGHGGAHVDAQDASAASPFPASALAPASAGPFCETRIENLLLATNMQSNMFVDAGPHACPGPDRLAVAASLRAVDVRQCGPGVAGMRVPLVIVVDPPGHVAEVEIEDSAFRVRPEGGCVTRAFASVHLPEDTPRSRIHTTAQLSMAPAP